VTLKRVLRAAFGALEALCARVFPAAWNPLQQLGALGWFLFWIITASGIYLYVFFDTGVTRAYESLEAITHAQWWAGGVLRSLHRYASDALVIMAKAYKVLEMDDLAADAVRVLEQNYPNHPGIYEVREVVVK